MRTAYIYHVIGTLEWWHIEMGMESLRQQREPFKDATFILYNGGTFPDADILRLVPKGVFDSILVYPYDPTTPKGAVADWQVQMRDIGGFDRYFCHKADFYLPRNAARIFNPSFVGVDPWFLLISKFDMKERAHPDDIRVYAESTWSKNMNRSSTGTIENHIGSWAVPWDAEIQPADGTMHAYSDALRPLFIATENDREKKWGVAYPVRRLDDMKVVIKNHDFYAVHMYHETPHREDEKKNIPGERF